MNLRKIAVLSVTALAVLGSTLAEARPGHRHSGARALLFAAPFIAGALASRHYYRRHIGRRTIAVYYYSPAPIYYSPPPVYIERARNTCRRLSRCTRCRRNRSIRRRRNRNIRHRRNPGV